MAREVEVNEDRWQSVRNPVIGEEYIIRWTHGNGRHARRHYEPVTFLGDMEGGDTLYRHFESTGDDGRTFDWKAYKFNGRWVMGSSADPISLGRLMSDEEVQLQQIKAQRFNLRCNIRKAHENIDRLKAEIASMETRFADLGLEGAEIKAQIESL